MIHMIVLISLALSFLFCDIEKSSENLSKKIVLSEWQTVRFQIRNDVRSVLIWVQTGCKGYQQSVHF